MNMKKQCKGIFYIILSAFCFSLMDMFVRMSGDLPSIQKSFFRNIVAAVFGCILVLKEKDSFQWKKGSGKYLILRSMFGTLGILCNFYAIDHLALADASMLNKMSPFFVVIFSFLLLKEKVTITQTLLVIGAFCGSLFVVKLADASMLNKMSPFFVVIFSFLLLKEKVTITQTLLVIGAFCGSLFVVKPTVSNLDLVPSLIGLLGGLGAGAAYTMVRKLGTIGVKGPFIVFFFSTFSCVVTLPWLIFDYHTMTLAQTVILLMAGVVTLPWLIFDYHTMTLAQTVILLMAGLCAAGGQFAITAAYCYAPASEVSIYDYTKVIFSMILGFVMFQQIPDFYSWVGYIIICLAAYCYAPASEVSIYDYTKVIFSMILGFVMFQQIPDFYSWVGYIIICLMAIFMFFYNKRRSAR